VPKSGAPRRPDPVPITERDGGYFYYHVNFGLTFGTHIALLALVASGTILEPEPSWVAAQAAANTPTDPDPEDEVLEKLVARLAWKGDTTSTIVLATLLQCVFVRQELFFIQPLYWLVARIPHSVPLGIRKRIARWVYSLGGFHSGSGCAMIAWITLLLVYQVMVYSNQRQLGVTLFGVPEKAIVENALLVALLCVVSATALWHRGQRHNLFEAVHRWVGWGSLALTWALLFEIDGMHPKPEKLWLLGLTTFFVFFPWAMIRRVSVSSISPSSHCVALEFHDAAPPCGTFGRIAHTPLGEYHTFAIITRSATPYTTDTQKHQMIIAGAGDWTRELIKNHPTRLWVRSIRTPGFMATVRMFESTILVHTGAGIAPGLPYIYQQWPNVKHVLWTTREPRVTFGDEVTDAVLAMPSVRIWDTQAEGRPNLEQLTIDAWMEHRTEAVHIVANEPITIKVVSACRKVGVPCFGAIWDS